MQREINKSSETVKVVQQLMQKAKKKKSLKTNQIVQKQANQFNEKQINLM
jgi:hypothetical protein